MKKISKRRCIACRASLPKMELVKLVCLAGNLKWDVKGNLPGRGAYVHRTAECWRKLHNTPVLLERALRTKFSPEQLQKLVASEACKV